MTKGSVVLLATVVMAIGAAIVGRSWVVGDESGDARRPATTVSRAERPMTAARALWIARQRVGAFKRQAARNGPFPVLHCKLVTPRQRYLCADARPWIRTFVAHLMGRPEAAGRGGTRCFFQSEDGELWTVDAGIAGRCL